MGENNKNSFRDMILIIFVVLVCFGITIYGIAYLTGKVFSSNTEVPVVENEKPKDITTNPSEGDTLTFTSIDEQSDEVTPDGDNIRMTTTPPVTEQDNMNNNIVVEDTNEMEVAQTPVMPVVPTENKVEPVRETTPIAPIKEETPKQVAKEQTPSKEVIKEQPKPERQEVVTAKQKAESKQQPQVKKETPKSQVKQEVKKEPVKVAPPKVSGNYVVQLLAVQSKASAEKEAAKYRSKYPDVFITQVVINGKTWYRVRLGVSSTREEAAQIANQVEREFKIKPKVTKNN